MTSQAYCVIKVSRALWRWFALSDRVDASLELYRDQMMALKIFRE